MSGRCRGESRKERSGHSLVPIPHSAPPGHPRSPRCTNREQAQRREGPRAGHTAPPSRRRPSESTTPSLELLLSSSPSVPQICQDQQNQVAREARRDRQVSLGVSGPPLSATSCLPLKVGRGVAGLGRNLWCLLFSVTVCILRLILRTRQESETRRAWAHHLKAGTGG